MTLPAYLQNSQGPRLAERTVANLGTIAPPYLSIAGNRFTLVDSTGAELPVTTLDPKTGMFFIDCVIIDALERESKIYYGKAYDPGAASFSPPDCWSDNGIGPSRSASAPQHTTCSGCPKAEWGSAVSRVSGKGVPACSKQQKLALMTLGNDMVFLLRVPPNSLKHLAEYLAKFTGQEGDVSDVVTRVTFVKETLGTLAFSAVSYIDEVTAAGRNLMLKAKKTDLLLGRGDMPREGLPRPAQVAQIEHIAAGVLPAAGPERLAVAPAGQAVPPVEASKRRRRTAAEIAAAEAPAAPTGVAPFRPEPSANGSTSFGIQSGVAPNAELSATLDSIFK